MTHLDLSMNNMTKINSKTFDGNNGLKTMKLSHNPITGLVYYQFPPLRSLKTIDLSNCEIEEVDRTAFKNLGPSVESVLLNNNRIRTMKEEVFVPLVNLKSLKLHSNPWVCDCKLKNFRDWVVTKRLYNRPTACAEPSRLADKLWDEVVPAEFACKPHIEIPFSRVFAAPGVDATLACHIVGSPVPQARWVVRGRIINNNTHPQPFADQTWIIREERVTYDGVQRWYNLTVTNPSESDLGDYLCVAENNGGVMESRVVLTFDDPATYNVPITDEQLTIIIGASVAIAVLFLLVVAVCCCCICRKSKKFKDSKRGHHPRHNHNQSLDSQKLLSNGTANNNPVPKPPRLGDYQGLPVSNGYISADKYNNDVEMQELRAPSVISTAKNSTANSSSSENGATVVSNGRNTAMSRTSFPDHHHLHYPLNPHPTPDLLAVIKPSSVSPSTASSSSMIHQLSPAGLILTTQSQQQQQYLASPFTRSGTLPLPHHHSHPRSSSCDHSAAPITVALPQFSNPHPLAAVPVVHQHHQHHNISRPGYVTLPRRPRSSWSVPRETPSPVASVVAREPIYDGIGPRTSADGSSRLSLNKSASGYNVVASSSSASVIPRYTLPPYCAPIEELAECPPTPKAQQTRMAKGLPKSTPNILSLNGNANDASVATSGSEATLIEENISGYCEPFGKALAPKAEAEDVGSNNRNSIASNDSELDKIITTKGTAKKGTNTNELNGQHDKSVPANGSFKSSTPLRNGGVHDDDDEGDNNSLQPLLSIAKGGENGIVIDLGNNRTNKSSGPKTLPKPKVKPVPPPKPKKSFHESAAANGDSSSAPLISFQDEGVDGSEV